MIGSLVAGVAVCGSNGVLRIWAYRIFCSCMMVLHLRVSVKVDKKVCIPRFVACLDCRAKALVKMTLAEIMDEGMPSYMQMRYFHDSGFDNTCADHHPQHH